MHVISDEQWFEANLNPQARTAGLELSVPDLPPDAIQLRFTGRAGRGNLRQAFDFYKFVLGCLPHDSRGRYRLVDFGGGWGRILRFFLREFEADRLVLIDCLTDAVECARSLNPPFAVIQSNVKPPLPFKTDSVDTCYAFSVFSHLSEQACRDWLSHLSELLVEGGKLIITTRGEAQIGTLRQIARPIGYIKRFIKRKKDHIHSLLTCLPRPNIVEELYDSGVFQFYPIGGGGELTEDFYGEAWIPELWMKQHYSSFGFSRYEFFPEFATIDQCTFVLTK